MHIRFPVQGSKVQDLAFLRPSFDVGCRMLDVWVIGFSVQVLRLSIAEILFDLIDL